MFGQLRRLTSYAACLGLLAALAACSGDDVEPSPAPGGSTAAVETESASASAAPSTSSAPLEWQKVSESADVVSSQTWTLAMTGADTASLTGPEDRELASEATLSISELLLDDDYAVVVLQDPMENDPGAADVYALDSANSFTVDSTSKVPTTNGGTWALGEGKLLHATYGPKNAYCLAEVDLASQESALAWCAPTNSGFNDARVTPAGVTVLSFTLGKEGCRTPVTIANGKATALPGITECIGWDSLLTPAGAIWSETPDPNQIEEATFFADTGSGPTELATGDTGSLTWCGSAAYFTQQPRRDGEPAHLMRWRDGTLDAVYETPGSPGFISEPRCGGNQLTITAQSEGGDEQVTAAVD
jgi:hypothetical protein